MLTYEDCLAFANLTEDEVRTIARHRQVPQMLALELGHYLASCPDGGPCVERMLHDDIDAARARGDMAEVTRLHRLLRHFVASRAKARNAA